MKSLLYSLLLLISVTVFSSCNENDPEPPTIFIGAFYQGGVIFYIDQTGEHGYISSIYDQSNGCIWGCNPTIISEAYGLAIGTGEQNTKDILNICTSPDIAAAICDTLQYNGFTDWFLPSKDELNLMYQHKGTINDTSIPNGGALLQGTNYWTSSQAGTNSVWVQYFGSGGSQYSNSQKSRNHVRAIRAF